jgi:uncharacterized coiled-coil DUF342 family protein
MAPEDDQLYVRINQQQDMVGNLEDLDGIINNINEATEILNQVREVKVTASDTISSNIEKLNESLENFEMAMPEVEGEQDHTVEEISDQTQSSVSSRNSVNEIHDELENLQDELNKLGQQ